MNLFVWPGSARGSRVSLDDGFSLAQWNDDGLNFAFGSTDVYCVADMPDNAAAAALALNVSAGGGATVSTTVLLGPDEIDQAAGAKVKYTPPGG